MVQVEANCSSLTTDDSFVLSLNNIVVIYTPFGSNNIEMKKAYQFSFYIFIIRGLQADQLIRISKS